MRSHFNEVAYMPPEEFDLDVEMYLASEEAGKTKMYTAHVGKRLVGYSVYHIRPHAHARKNICAVMDCIYVDPSYRGQSIGKYLISFADAHLQDIGCHYVFNSMSVANKTDSLKAIGYRHIDNLFIRRF